MVRICTDCKEKKEIITKSRCWPCYQRKRRKTYVPPPPRKEQCSVCREVKRVVLRTEKGKAVCNACYQREFYEPSQEQCSVCREVKRVVLRTEKGKAVCNACYQREFLL